MFGMKYNKDNIFKKSKEAITKHKLIYISDVLAFVPCSKTTFYELFKDGSDELNELREMLERNRIEIKTAIRRKLFESDKAGELLALYRLCATPEERQILNQQYIEVSKSDKNKGFLPVDLTIKTNNDDNAKPNNTANSEEEGQ